MSSDPRTIAIFAGSLRPDGVSAATAHSAKAALPAHLRAAVRATASQDGDSDIAAKLGRLTPQQFKVLTRVAEGQLNKQIADALGISERTVKAHVSALFERLDVRNRTQAGVLLRSLELSDPNRAWPGEAQS